MNKIDILKTISDLEREALSLEHHMERFESVSTHFKNQMHSIRTSISDLKEKAAQLPEPDSHT